MTQVKHLIITRFMCDNFIKKDTGIDINNSEWNNVAFDMAKRHIIPTLENQTAKAFTLVFLVSDKISDDVERIYNLSAKLNIDVVYYNNFESYIKSCDEDYLITSRLDYDDHVHNRCVEEIHQRFYEDILDKQDFALYGLTQGISVIDGETDAYLCNYEFPWLKTEGFPAPMVTLILKKEAVKFYFDIYKLGFHTEVIKNLRNVIPYYFNNRDYEVTPMYSVNRGRKLEYIWTRHKHSATYLFDGTVHTTNIKVDISEKELKDIFGYTK